MESILEELKRTIESSNLYSIGPYKYFVFPFKGLSPINPKTLNSITKLMKDGMPKEKNYKIFTFMVDGIVIALPLSMLIEKPLIIARDFNYNIPDIKSFVQKTKYYERKMFFSGIERDDKVAIVDCIISSGGSVLNAIEEIEKTGCKILGVNVMIDKIDYGGSDIVRERGYKFNSLLDVRIDGDKITCTPSKKLNKEIAKLDSLSH